MAKKQYFCSKCKQKHNRESVIGVKHLEFQGEAPEPKVEEEKHEEVCPKCNGTGIIEYEAGLVQQKCDCGAIPVEERIREGATEPSVGTKPPRSGERCGICHDTGFVLIGPGGKYRRFCICGQETEDERIGVIPRRDHLGKAKRITRADRAEALSRITQGSPSGAGPDDRDSGGEDSGESEVAKEPAANEGVSGSTTQVLQIVGESVSISEGK